MQIGAFRTQMAEALKKVREADTDEARTTALQEVEALEAEAAKIDAPPKAPDSVEALTESAPKLVEQMREAIKAEAATEAKDLQEQVTELKGKLQEATTVLSGIADVRQIADVLREAGVTEEAELRYFTDKARERKLREADDIKDMVKVQRDYHEHQLAKLAEAADLPDVEGVYARRLAEPVADGGAAELREAGVPVKDAA